MQIRLRVALEGQPPYEVTTNLFTVVAMERRFKIRATDLEHGVAVEHLAFLAYEASKQNGVTVPIVFDDFIKQVTTIDVMDGPDANPTSGDQ